MKKTLLTQMIFSICLLNAAHAQERTFTHPMNEWMDMFLSDNFNIQGKYVPLTAYNQRLGRSIITGVSRVDLKIINLRDVYQCATVIISDVDRPTAALNNYQRTHILLQPYETKNIGYLKPVIKDDFEYHYGIELWPVFHSRFGGAQCNTTLSDAKDTSPKNTSPTVSEEDCYITTAMCRDTGKADDCEELQTLRKYRDDVMLQDEIGRELVKEYYLKAPKIVANINQQADHTAIYRDLREQYIVPAADAARLGKNEEALRIYQSMVTKLEAQYL